MSRETGFAIEIRERYQDVVGDRWPAAVDPQPDELLSSWLHRLAIANGVAPRAFAGVLGLGGGMWSPRLDVRLPKDLAAWLGVRTGVAPEAMSAMAMSDGELAPLCLPLRETTRRSRSTWTPVLRFVPCRRSRSLFSAVLATRLADFVLPAWLRPAGPMSRLPRRDSAVRSDGLDPAICLRALRFRPARRREDIGRGGGAAAGTVDRRYLQGGNRQEFAAIHEWVARLLRVPVIAGVGSGRPLANLSASALIRCFERLAQRTDDGTRTNETAFRYP